MSELTHILFVADIVGQQGLDTLASILPRLHQSHEIDMVIVNGENVTKGKGLDDKSVQILWDMGVHVITSGNHIWQRRKYLKQLVSNPNVLRPLNYPSEVPGHGSCIYETKKNIRVGVINLQGRSFMYPIDCPFKCVISEIELLKKKDVQCIIVDFHAEATAEKIALAYFLDGKISCVVGTHTHVQTADEQILPHGTAFITDVGMTGSHYSVIGMDIDTAIQRFITQIPIHYTIGSDVDLKFCGAYITVDHKTGKACSIKRLRIDI
ncbi:TIGR00282 family metallophosphoesterase [bacterium]|nr:TIGR00282 family metallophosphoesterase [bacterium]